MCYEFVCLLFTDQTESSRPVVIINVSVGVSLPLIILLIITAGSVTVIVLYKRKAKRYTFIQLRHLHCVYIDCPVLILPTCIINFITGGRVKGILDGRNQVRAILLLTILLSAYCDMHV